MLQTVPRVVGALVPGWTSLDPTSKNCTTTANPMLQHRCVVFTQTFLIRCNGVSTIGWRCDTISAHLTWYLTYGTHSLGILKKTTGISGKVHEQMMLARWACIGTCTRGRLLVLRLAQSHLPLIPSQVLLQLSLL